MSRSIHTTRRTVLDLTKQAASRGESETPVLTKAMESLVRKRKAKMQVRRERSSPNLEPDSPTPLENIRIHVADEGLHVHQPASADDVRSVLKALPPSTTDGITEICLNSEKAWMDCAPYPDRTSRDPFIGRPSVRVFADVYAGFYLGYYQPSSSRIAICSFVYDETRLPLPKPICDLYLRLHTLTTLVHEVAHHHDRTRRVGRGRWLADRELNRECYAEKMEEQWALEIVVPYLERAYPREVLALRKWVARRGGLLLPLAFFVNACRKTRRDGLQRLIVSSSSAFEWWIDELPDCQNLAASRLAFAWQLHYADLYERCLQLLDQELEGQAASVPLLACKADTLVHLNRLEEALSIADETIRLDPANPTAWEARGDQFERRKDWRGLLENCNRWETSGRQPSRARREICMHRAVAHCGLEDFTAMEASLVAYIALTRPAEEEVKKRRAVYARRRVFRRAGRKDPLAIK